MHRYIHRDSRRDTRIERDAQIHTKPQGIHRYRDIHTYRDSRRHTRMERTRTTIYIYTLVERCFFLVAIPYTRRDEKRRLKISAHTLKWQKRGAGAHFSFFFSQWTCCQHRCLGVANTDVFMRSCSVL
jgi:hypothetical protein